MSLDFVSDALSDGRRFRILSVVDTSLSSARVVRELDRVIDMRGAPKLIVSDNGTELTSKAILTWATESKIDLALHHSRTPDGEWLHREF